MNTEKRKKKTFRQYLIVRLTLYHLLKKREKGVTAVNISFKFVMGSHDLRAEDIDMSRGRRPLCLYAHDE